ncbi:MAG: hypothetical protein EOP94_01340 [Zymomonas sp.]|nr:MAG: hypothetical protein EOP94_01340 [Zymomonas sp.]
MLVASNVTPIRYAATVDPSGTELSAKSPPSDAPSAGTPAPAFASIRPASRNPSRMYPNDLPLPPAGISYADANANGQLGWVSRSEG